MANLMRTAITACLLLPLVGCQWVAPRASQKSLLTVAKPSPDSVALEIFFARFSCGEAEINGPMWDEIDEQQFPPEVRRQLTQNGFRAGVVGSHVPDQLIKLLKVTDAPHKSAGEQVQTLDAEPTVSLRVLHSRSGQRNEVITSQVYEQLPLLVREGEQLRGRTYHKAEGRFSLAAFPETDGRVRLELLPELQHGEPQQKWVGSDGIMRLDSSRPKHMFEELGLKVALMPGQMLVVTSLVDRPGSLGHYFFTEPKNDSLTQRLLVVRASQAAEEQLFKDGPTKVADLGFAE